MYAVHVLMIGMPECVVCWEYSSFLDCIDIKERK